MIFPIGDDNRDRRIFPVLNVVLIALNVLVFVVFQGMGANERFTYAFSTVPAEIVTGKDIERSVPIEDPRSGRVVGTFELGETPIPVWGTILTSMFMHGSFMHLFGNMMFLWIFGDNLEDRMGRPRYLVFYLLTGVVAALVHVFTTVLWGGNPLIPCLGASGAISGVLGGYLKLFPHRRVKVIMLRMLTEVPAIVAIGIWFAFQILSSFLEAGRSGGGVAYGAHIGGFVAGLVLVLFFAPRAAPAGPTALRGI